MQEMRCGGIYAQACERNSVGTAGEVQQNIRWYVGTIGYKVASTDRAVR